MNGQERDLDFQLGDALAENRALKAAIQAALDALKQILPMAEESLTRPNLSVEILDAHAAITQWIGLTDEENHIAEVLNKKLGRQYVADKLQEKNVKPWVGLTDEDIKTMYLRAHDNNMYMGWLAVAVAFARAIEAKLKEKNT